jgi:apolipoprotein N-acyltransferase
MVAWLGGPVIGIANGTLREVAYKDRVGELTAHQISTGTAIGLFAGYFELLARWRPLPSAREAREVGVAWLALTIAFEFGFGHYVAHTSWRELFADYDLRKGRLWPLVLAWIVLGPTVVRAGRER